MDCHTATQPTPVVAGDKAKATAIAPVVPTEAQSAPANPTFVALPVNPLDDGRAGAASPPSPSTWTPLPTLFTRNYIRQGQLPRDRGPMRMEEFINAFDYNYPRGTNAADQAEPVFTIHAAAAPSPFNASGATGTTLLKIGVRGKVVGRDGRKPNHLVLVVDTSGSMAQPDRLPLVQFALTTLANRTGAQARPTAYAHHAFDTRRKPRSFWKTCLRTRRTRSSALHRLPPLPGTPPTCWPR